MPPGRTNAWRDFAGGVTGVHAAVFALLHGRTFVGRLAGPVFTNAVAFVLLLALGVLVLWPAFAACFDGPWWLLDGWRADLAGTGPGRWLATTWLVLGPPLLDALVGVFQEPLRRATETAVLGSDVAATAQRPVRRVRERAQVLAGALLVWPVALVLSLVPWVGLPLVAALGAAGASIVWFEPPLAARGLPLRTRLDLLWRNRWRALGTGLGVQCAAAVPFVNLLALAPAATVAATVAYLRFDKGARTADERASAPIGS